MQPTNRCEKSCCNLLNPVAVLVGKGQRPQSSWRNGSMRLLKCVCVHIRVFACVYLCVHVPREIAELCMCVYTCICVCLSVRARDRACICVC